MFGWTWEIEHKMYCLLLTWVSVWDSAPYFHSSVSSVNFVLWRGGVQKYFLYARMSIQCVECAITEIYLLLVARNLLKYMLLFIVFLLRHFALLVTSLSHRRLCRVKYMLAMYLIYQKAGLTTLLPLSLQPLIPLSKCRTIGLRISSYQKIAELRPRIRRTFQQ